MQKGLLLGMLFLCEVFSAKELQEWEFVSNYNDDDFSQHILWTVAVKSAAICGSICTSHSQCLSYTWNIYQLTCKGFSKIYYSTATSTSTGNRYFRRKGVCDSHGYLTTTTLPDTPLCLLFKTAPLQATPALAQCRMISSIFGTLLRIRNIQTSQYIASYLVSIGAADDVFIDGSDIEIQDLWKYSDDTLVTYIRWAPFEPSSILGGDERCLTLQDYVPIFGQHFQKMNDKPCYDPLPYLCQLDIYA